MENNSLSSTDMGEINTNSKQGSVSFVKSIIPDIKADSSYFIPSLLEEPEIKCKEFKMMVDNLIDSLEDEINKINDKYTSVDTKKHIRNTKNVVLSMYSCIDCIIENIHSDEVIECTEDMSDESSGSSDDESDDESDESDGENFVLYNTTTSNKQ